MSVLAICTGMGLMDRAFLDAGFHVIPGCEIDPEMSAMHDELCGGEYITRDLKDLIEEVRGKRFTGIIGGPSCQAHTKLKSIRTPKFPDLSPLVNELLQATEWDWFLFENVVRIPIEDAAHTLLDAMHFHAPHQSRPRWFTHSPNVDPPRAQFVGTVDDLMAYPGVYGRLYGPKRGSRLQGYPSLAQLPFPCTVLQKGIANAVPYPVSMAWARNIATLGMNDGLDL